MAIVAGIDSRAMARRSRAVTASSGRPASTITKTGSGTTRAAEHRQNTAKPSQSYKDKGYNSKQSEAKLRVPSPQAVVDVQRANKGKTKPVYATPNIFELLDTSD